MLIDPLLAEKGKKMFAWQVFKEPNDKRRAVNNVKK
jgi:hypothetical protein